jgi:ring-1,2-phenylacetyl-CoA epoxidase subunit PaaC
VSAAAPLAAVEHAEDLSPEARRALRDLLLALADSKRILGLRYSDRMLGAPTLEAGIAASSMAQDEWGHARLTYALLADFGDDPKALEHDRPAGEYRSHPALDAPPGSWPELIAAMLTVDVALTAQYAALAESRYAPARHRVQKMLDEERIHFQYAAGWVRRMAAVPALREELAAALERYLPAALRWPGDDAADAARRLLADGLASATPSGVRGSLLERIAPVLEEAGLAGRLGIVREGDGWRHGGELDLAGRDAATPRSGGSLDEETAARARGDRNRALRID